ncbi:MAG: tRNA lysidine(34) synthetase TilS [Candidatus Moranbacteria bacterium]|nr:tRNA lysidine(34) synthetase TilS [Candidatus Moranbacteria bacterium]
MKKSSRSSMKNLLKKIQTASHQYGLWDTGSKIILGVSGGPDSACLLDIFLRLQKTYAFKLRIAHINYGLRGKDSASDEKFVQELAGKYGLALDVLRPEITSSKNLESRLRDIRYDFFEKIRQKNDFDLVAVAHNLDDQAETVLMRLMRGSGLAGLSAMKFKSGNIIRPLLATSRQEITDYLKNRRLESRIDKTNFESDFLRNKIRHKLIPYIENNYNPDIKKTLSVSAISIAEDHSFINDFAEKTFQAHRELSARKILSFHPAIQRRVLRLAIAEKKQNIKDIGMSHIEEIIKALRSTKSKNQNVIFKGLKMSRKGDKITISKL